MLQAFHKRLSAIRGQQYLQCQFPCLCTDYMRSWSIPSKALYRNEFLAHNSPIYNRFDRVTQKTGDVIMLWKQLSKGMCWKYNTLVLFVYMLLLVPSSAFWLGSGNACDHDLSCTRTHDFALGGCVGSWTDAARLLRAGCLVHPFRRFHEHVMPNRLRRGTMAGFPTNAGGVIPTRIAASPTRAICW